jgi:hypothetical protein
VKRLILWLCEAFIGKIELSDLGSFFRMLAEKVYNCRRLNDGLVPPEIFEPCLSMSGMTVSAQIVNEVVDATGTHVGYALRQREKDEVGSKWVGLYHSTCTVGRMVDTPTSMLSRNMAQAYGHPKLDESLEFLGVTINDEPERWSSCLTVMYRRKIKEKELSLFIGKWVVFTDEQIFSHDERIINHNWYLLEWVIDEKRSKFADVRGGWKPKKI